jgi:hypothetical protein
MSTPQGTRTLLSGVRARSITIHARDAWRRRRGRTRTSPFGARRLSRLQPAPVGWRFHRRKVRDSNPPSARHAVRRFQRRPSTSRSPSMAAESGIEPLRVLPQPHSRRWPAPAVGWLLHASGWPELNRRPRGPEPRALPSCATTRWSGRPDFEPTAPGLPDRCADLPALRPDACPEQDSNLRPPDP